MSSSDARKRKPESSTTTSSSSRPPHHHHSSSSSKKSKSSAVIPSAAADSSSATAKKAKSQFLCELEYSNTLPPPPFDPKLLKFNLNPDRLLTYFTTTIEKNHIYPLLFDKMIGIPLNLVDIEQYQRPNNIEKGRLDIEDEELLPMDENKSSLNKLKQNFPTQYQLYQQGSSNWMKKPEYTLNNLYDSANKQIALTDQKQAEYQKVQLLKKQRDNSKETQIQIIQETFEQAKKLPKHPTNPALSVVKTYAIFPDISNHSYSWIQYDKDPYTGDNTHLERHLIESRGGNNANNNNNNGTTTSSSSNNNNNNDFIGPNVIAVDDHLLQEYDQKYYGLYIKKESKSNNNNNNNSNNNNNGGENKEMEDTEEVNPEQSSIENNANSDKFKWSREYTTIPTAAVDFTNNYFFIENPLNSSELLYSSYSQRLRLAKRTHTRGDLSASIIESRPKSIVLEWRNEEEIEKERERREEEEKKEKEREAKRKEREERKKKQLEEDARARIEAEKAELEGEEMEGDEGGEEEEEL